MELTYDILLESYMYLSKEYTELRDDYDRLKAKMTDVIAELLLELGEARYEANMESSKVYDWLIAMSIEKLTE